MTLVALVRAGEKSVRRPRPWTHGVAQTKLGIYRIDIVHKKHNKSKIKTNQNGKKDEGKEKKKEKKERKEDKWGKIDLDLSLGIQNHFKTKQIVSRQKKREG